MRLETVDMPDKKTVLLLNPPGDKLYARDKYCTSVSKSSYYWPQVDLLMLSGFLHRDYRVHVIDAIAQSMSPERCFSSIARLRPDAIVFLTCLATWKADFEFVASVKRQTGAECIANGGFLLARGKEAMESHDFLDAVLLKFTTPDILRYLDGQRDGLRNIIFRCGAEIVNTGRSKEKPFTVPVPRHELFPLETYSFPLGRRPKYTCVMASAGCPFHCSFCIPATLDYELRDIDNLMEELRHIKSLGIRELLFQDPTFSANRRHAAAVCERIISEDLRLDWICQTRVDTVDAELLALMKHAGCHSIDFGIESGNEMILQSMSKGITKDKARTAFGLCRTAGIRASGFFIIGMPGETEETVLDTIRFAKELDCHVASFSIPIPYGETPLGKTLGAGPMPETMDDVTEPSFETDSLSKRRILELRNRAYREFYLRPGYVIRRVLQISTWHEFKVNLRGFLAILGHYNAEH
jgi:radical SAM superfamily enzyme YgiQ (UPF0313 family)